MSTGEAMSTDDQKMTIRATDLAEWIVDEISEAGRDWQVIEARARELVELAAHQATARDTRGPMLELPCQPRRSTSC